MGIYHRAKIRSYQDAQQLFSTARNPAKGKPINSWSRLYCEDNDVYVLRHTQFSDIVLGRIYPDNTLELPLDRRTMRMVSATLTGSFHKVLPVALRRVGTGRYIMMPTHMLDEIIDRSRSRLDILCEDGFQLFDGIKVNLDYHTVVNPKATNNGEIDPEQRKVWLRQLRAFKKGMKVRAKMGVLDAACAKVASDRHATNNWRRPDWYSETWVNTLYESIRDLDYSNEILEGFAQTADVAYWKREAPTPAKVIEAVDKVCNDLSVELRSMFGVFKEPL